MKKSIKYLSIGFSAAVVLALGSCSKSSSSLPPINGYNTANDIAAANLLAHWTFDNTKNEIISGTAPEKDSASSYTTGQIGQALQLDSGYLRFPTITSLSSANAFPSVTVSLWVKIANTSKKQTNLFSITQTNTAQTDWNTGPLNVYVETGNHKATSDTLQLHSSFSTWINGTRYGGDNVNAYGVAGTDYQWAPFGGTWMHYVMVYDGSGSNIDLYANGVKVSNNNFRHRTYGNPAVGFGNLALDATNSLPTKVLIGGWPNKSRGYTNSPTQSWQGYAKASLDDIRVFSKALTDAEIGSLYAFGQAGR